MEGVSAGSGAATVTSEKACLCRSCKDLRETPSSAASQRQTGALDAAKLSLVVVDSKQRKTSRIRRAQPLNAWFWVLFPRRTPRPSSCDSTTSRLSHFHPLAPSRMRCSLSVAMSGCSLSTCNLPSIALITLVANLTAEKATPFFI